MQESVQTKDDLVIDASVEQLPIHVIRERLDAKGIAYKSTNKKKDLIKALLTGESVEKKAEKKAAPRMEDKVSVKPLAILSDKLKETLDAMAAQGLRYEIDEEFSCINFYGKIPTCANIDQPMSNILSAARDAIRLQAVPIETNNTKDLW